MSINPTREEQSAMAHSIWVGYGSRQNDPSTLTYWGMARTMWSPKTGYAPFGGITPESTMRSAHCNGMNGNGAMPFRGQLWNK